MTVIALEYTFGVHMEYCALKGFLVVLIIQGREVVDRCDYVYSDVLMNESQLLTDSKPLV